MYSVGRLCEPCLEHIDNNFTPLDAIQKGEFTDVAEDICYLLQVCRHKRETNNYDELETEIRKANDLNGQLSHLKREELQRIQSQSGSIKVSMVYPVSYTHLHLFTSLLCLLRSIVLLTSVRNGRHPLMKRSSLSYPDRGRHIYKLINVLLL